MGSKKKAPKSKVKKAKAKKKVTKRKTPSRKKATKKKARGAKKVSPKTAFHAAAEEMEGQVVPGGDPNDETPAILSPDEMIPAGAEIEDEDDETEIAEDMQEDFDDEDEEDFDDGEESLS